MPRFPALDPEPPPTPWWRRLLPPAGVLGLGGAVAAAVLFWPVGGGAAARPPHHTVSRVAAAAAGRILSTIGPDLYMSAPDGAYRRKLAASTGGNPVLALSPTGRWLIDFSSDEVSRVGANGLLGPFNEFPGSLGNGTFTVGGYPFAARDVDAVVGGLGTADPVYLVSLADGQSVTLGTGHLTAGDPRTPGAFFSIGTALPAAQANPNPATQPDVELDFRAVGGPTRTLLTAVQAVRTLGLPAGTAVALAPEPDPTGALVAVVVTPVTVPPPPTGVVIITRTGRVVDHSSVAGVEGAVWSPRGDMLAFAPPPMEPGGPVTGDPHTLLIWTPGHGILKVPLPVDQPGYGDCLWSPDETHLLCAAVGTNHAPGQAWLVVDLRSGGTGEVATDALPWVWLPVAGGSG